MGGWGECSSGGMINSCVLCCESCWFQCEFSLIWTLLSLNDELRCVFFMWKRLISVRMSVRFLTRAMFWWVTQIVCRVVMSVFVVF